MIIPRTGGGGEVLLGVLWSTEVVEAEEEVDQY